MIWFPALAAYSYYLSLERKLQQALKNGTSADLAVEPRMQINLQCADVRETCLRIVLFSSENDEKFNCEDVLENGSLCLYCALEKSLMIGIVSMMMISR
jgi:hypothetical protein